MTGIEIAGLVLGGFPILLNALDYYREGFEPLDEYWGFRTHFVLFVDDVNHQLMLYTENLTRLLDPIVTDEDDLRHLVRDANDPRWNDTSLDEALRGRLSSEQARYLRILARMEEVLSELKRLLRVQDTGWVDSEDRPLAFHLRRLQVSFSRGKQKKVDKLAKYNKELSDILGYSERIIPIADARKSSVPVTSLEKFRQQACSVHLALQSHWKCQCPRSFTHRAHLRVRSLNGDAKEELLEVVFTVDEVNARPCKYPISICARVAVPTASAASSATSLAVVQKAEPLVALQQNFQLKNPKKASRLSRLFHRSRSGSTQAAGAPVPHALQPPSLVVTPPVVRHVSAPAASGTGSLTSMTSTSSFSTHRIDDLCSTLRASQENPLGYIMDEYDRSFDLRRSSDDDISINTQAQFSTLSRLLQLTHQARIEFPRQKRFETAAHVASAMLQLQVSPWLNAKWSTNDFYLACDTTAIYSKQTYVTRLFHSAHLAHGATPNPDSLSEDETRHSLFHLGVTILELIFGYTIQDCPIRTQYLGANNTANDQTDVSTARKWSEKVLGECGVELADVVRRCLDCSFGPRPNFADKRFREAVYVGVVEPLQDYLKTWKIVVN